MTSRAGNVYWRPGNDLDVEKDIEKAAQYFNTRKGIISGEVIAKLEFLGKKDGNVKGRFASRLGMTPWRAVVYPEAVVWVIYYVTEDRSKGLIIHISGQNCAKGRPPKIPDEAAWEVARTRLRRYGF